MISSVPISRVVKSNFPCDGSADHQLSLIYFPLALAPLRWSPWDDYGYFHQTTCLKTVMEILIKLYIAVNYCNWVYCIYPGVLLIDTILSTKLSQVTGCFHRHFNSRVSPNEIESRSGACMLLSSASPWEWNWIEILPLNSVVHWTPLFTYMSLASGWSHWKTRSYRAETSCSRHRVMTYVRSYINKNPSLSRMPYFIWVADSSRGSCRL